MTQLYRLTYKGNLPAGDVFAYGLHLTAPDGSAIADILTRGVAGLTALLTTSGGVQTYYSTNTVWAEVQAELLNPATGKVITARSQAVSRAGSATGFNPLPGNIAVVATLRTATPGRSGRGRFYLPAPAVNALTATGQMLAATQTAYSVSVAAMLNSLNSGTPVLDPVVYSLKNHSYASITQYDVGNIYDQQGRRRNKLTEGRLGGTITP